MDRQATRKGYKLTELGEIPNDWMIASFPEYVWFQEGPGLRKWQFRSKGLKVINVTNLTEAGVLDLSKTERHISWEEFEKMYKHFLCDAGDFVMASSGNSYCKSSVVRECDLPLLMNTSVIRFKPINGMVGKYLQSYMRSRYFKEQVDLLITGGAQPNFGPFHLEKIRLPLPSRATEQTAIANALSDTDALITSLEKLINKKRAIKTATMQQVLTGKTRLPGFDKHPNGKPKGTKQTELGEIPEDWEVRPLEELLAHGPKYGINAAAVPLTGKLPIYIRITDINDEGYFKPTEKVGVDNPFSDEYKLEGGDIVVARTGASVGKSYLYRKEDGELIFAGFLIKLSPGNQLSSRYLFQYFKTNAYWNWVTVMSMRSGQPGINGKEYGQQQIPVPLSDEQTAIANVLSDMDDEIEALEQRLEKTKQIKQGMMQELLTGRTRLV